MARAFHFNISLRLIRSHYASALRLFAVSAIAVLIAGGAAWMYDREWTSLREKEQAFIISVVLQPSVDAATAYRAASTVRTFSSVAEVSVITPEQWRAEFAQRYGVEIAEVVPENPFSYALRVRLIEGSINAVSFTTAYQQIREMHAVVDDIQYPSDMLRSILNQTSLITTKLSIVISLAILSILFLLTSTVRATSAVSASDLQLMTLLGGRSTLVSRPTMWRNLLVCLPGIGLGALCIVFALPLLRVWWPLETPPPVNAIIGSASAGTLLILVAISILPVSRRSI